MAVPALMPATTRGHGPTGVKAGAEGILDTTDLLHCRLRGSR